MRDIMKRFMLCLIVLMTLLCGWMFYQKQVQLGPQPHASLSYEKDDLKSAIVLPKDPAAIEIINKKNSQVKSFSCDRIDVKVWQEGRKFKLTASMYYEKDKRFRMITNSVFGKELDLGSNDRQFWFWSKRMQPPGLYFANHEDFNKTRLKTPFNPKWMMTALGLETIQTDNCKIVELKTKYILISNHTNSIGEPITKMTYINKITNKVDGYLLVDKNNKNIASAEVLAWNGDLPQQILFSWFEEGSSMLMDMVGPKLNVPIDARYWQMPNLNPKIDMSKDDNTCSLSY